MSFGALLTLVAILGIYLVLELGIAHLLRRGLRWVADTVDRLCGLDTRGR